VSTRIRVAVVDANAFFCNCEVLFKPALRGKPVLVLSNNDGCVVSRTMEAKKLGIKMGDPYFKIRPLCEKNNVYIFSSNFSIYTNISDRMMSTLQKMVQVIEPYSVDEAFLNLDQISDEKLHSFGREIKSTIERDVGIPVCVGIGPTKTLAKAAIERAKSDLTYGGVVDITPPDLRESLLEEIAIEDVWGVGGAWSKVLRARGIGTAKEFRDYKHSHTIRKKLTKVGLQMQMELNGEMVYSVNPNSSPKKSIITSRTFSKPITSREKLNECVASYTSSAMEKLREQNSVCRSISVWIRTSPFSPEQQYGASASEFFITGTLDTRKGIRAALSVLDTIYRDGYRYKKAGVLLSNIVDRFHTQLALFDNGDSDKDVMLMQTMDMINEKEGESILKIAACGTNNSAWRMLREYKSPRFTTSWHELPKVK
jgi:DNA polymerase V